MSALLKNYPNKIENILNYCYNIKRGYGDMPCFNLEVKYGDNKKC